MQPKLVHPVHLQLEGYVLVGGKVTTLKLEKGTEPMYILLARTTPDH